MKLARRQVITAVSAVAISGCVGTVQTLSDAGVSAGGDGGKADGGVIDAGAPTDAGVMAHQPSWNTGQAVNEWREIAGSSMNLSAPTHTALTLSGGSAVVGPSSRMDAWCGLSIDTRSSWVWSAANGGHGDYYGNEVVKLDLMADAPAWVEWFAGSNGKVVDNSTTPGTASLARYQDGLPCSCHSFTANNSSSATIGPCGWAARWRPTARAGKTSRPLT